MAAAAAAMASYEAWQATWCEVGKAGALQGWAPRCFFPFLNRQRFWLLCKGLENCIHSHIEN